MHDLQEKCTTCMKNARKLHGVHGKCTVASERFEGGNSAALKPTYHAFETRAL